MGKGKRVRTRRNILGSLSKGLWGPWEVFPDRETRRWPVFIGVNSMVYLGRGGLNHRILTKVILFNLMCSGKWRATAF